MSRERVASGLGIASTCVGLSFCGFNVYWLLGGHLGLATASAEPIPMSAMAVMTVIKIGGALLGLTAATHLTRLLPRLLRRLLRGLAWAGVAVLAGRTVPFLVIDIASAASHTPGSGTAWYWNTWFALWLAAFLPAMLLSKPKRTGRPAAPACRPAAE